jgi:hypothetical protein
MDERTFWINIWRTAGAVLCAMVLTFAGCDGYKSARIAEMTANGMDPMRAACAINGVGDRSAAICGVLASK